MENVSDIREEGEIAAPAKGEYTNLLDEEDVDSEEEAQVRFSIISSSSISDSLRNLLSLLEAVETEESADQ